eukprot:36331_1
MWVTTHHLFVIPIHNLSKNQTIFNKQTTHQQHIYKYDINYILCRYSDNYLSCLRWMHQNHPKLFYIDTKYLKQRDIDTFQQIKHLLNHLTIINIDEQTDEKSIKQPKLSNNNHQTFRKIKKIYTRHKPKTFNRKQKFRYLVVLNLEATCAENRKPNPSQEIIEWSATIIDTKTNEIFDNCKDDIFHYYIKPKYNPKLTQLCIQTTNITQQMIDTGHNIQSVVLNWNEWCFRNNLLPNMRSHKPNACIITYGECNLKKIWSQQQKLNIQSKIT